MKEPDEERGWHIEIDIGISSMYVHMHVLNSKVYSYTEQARPSFWSHPPMVRMREI